MVSSVENGTILVLIVNNPRNVLCLYLGAGCQSKSAEEYVIYTALSLRVNSSFIVRFLS
jgi:hypothetical protein